MSGIDSKSTPGKGAQDRHALRDLKRNEVVVLIQSFTRERIWLPSTELRTTEEEGMPPGIRTTSYERTSMGFGFVQLHCDAVYVLGCTVEAYSSVVLTVPSTMARVVAPVTVMHMATVSWQALSGTSR